MCYSTGFGRVRKSVSVEDGRIFCSARIIIQLFLCVFSFSTCLVSFFVVAVHFLMLVCMIVMLGVFVTEGAIVTGACVSF